MVYFTDFAVSHVALLTAQERQRREHEFMTALDVDHLQTSPAETAWLRPGVVLACAGLVTLWPGRAVAWALLSSDVGPYMTSVIKRMRKMLDGPQAPRRVEMTTTEGFAEAERLAHMLGFEREGPLRPLYMPDGSTVQGWRRLR